MTAQTAPAMPESPGVMVRQRRLGFGDPILAWAVRAFSWLALAAVIVMLIDTAANSFKLLQHESLWDFLTGTIWSPASTVYGAVPFIYGTAVTSIIALVFAVPLALGCALLVNEYLPRGLAPPVGYAIELLAAVPSVVYGFWGITVLVPVLRPVQEALAESPLGVFPVFAGPVSGQS